jgi:diphthamide biosynthesis protein 7
MRSPHARKLAGTTTHLPPCVVQFHPKNDSFLFAGTYKLEHDGSRNGSLDIYRINNGELYV